jgi:predicted  nucleic acid-binding Zn-ribbon protein
LGNHLENASEAASSTQREIPTCRDTISGLEAEFEKAETSCQALNDQLQKEASMTVKMVSRMTSNLQEATTEWKTLGGDLESSQYRETVLQDELSKLQMQFSDASRRVLAVDEDQVVARARHQER